MFIKLYDNPDTMKYNLRTERKSHFHVIRLLLLSVCLLVFLGSCVREAPKSVSKPAGDDLPIESGASIDALTIFFTGNELGALKPCGCSGGQLGGIDRRSAVFDSVPDRNRLIVDTGSFVQNEREQAMIKFNILVRAFKLLDYDLVNLTSKDIQTARNLGLLVNPTVEFVSSYTLEDDKVRTAFTKRYMLKDEPLDVSIVPFDPQMTNEQISELLSSKAGVRSVNVLILNHYNGQILERIKRDLPSVDCLVCPAEGDEPARMGDPGAGPLMFSIGRYGKYVCKLEITGSAQADGKKPVLSYSSVPVTEDLPHNISLVNLYKAYQKIVRQSNLLESHPRFTIDEGLKYVGSESCQSCHEEIYDKWKQFGHADAYSTLVEVGSEADPECIGCHVVGFDYETGYVSKEKTPNLINVGCENCHGPGSEHKKIVGNVATGDPKLFCEDCHTPEHSSSFAAQKDEYFSKIKHWTELKSDRDVK